ncbi:hypothetical protein ACYOEI_13625, partial [Singulisphaera rosea]
NALAAAVTSSNITSTDLATIDADWTAVLAALGDNTDAGAFPYFTLVIGPMGPGGGGGGPSGNDGPPTGFGGSGGGGMC